MKKIALTLFFCGFTLIVKSQNLTEQVQKPSVEKSIFGIQTGFAGLWVYNEFKLSRQVALRTEFGLEAYDNDDFYPDAGFLLATVISLEPRWYYNLKKRKNKSKRIDNNSGNFFALKTSFHSDDLLIKFGNDSDVKIVNDLSIIPTWGIRRNIGKYFNYETGVGVGYIHYFSENSGFEKDEGEVAINLHLRIGYQF
ncbi:hypothetical protein SAMN04487910_4335 [Aquimarina amphilecti]|uniref:DUF3575 domain-containing protein n=2 Tax=Aquimarina amphilecti TaxID=1038014 RepID=A0A1H7W9U6_AQUAM|nr:hypothetical protein SAMN04487910_4335 [Aquimarina amphilecti]